MDNLYVGSYSIKQKCYDIRTLKETLEINNKTIAEGIETGYQILCIKDSYDKAKEYLEEYRNKIKER